MKTKLGLQVITNKELVEIETVDHVTFLSHIQATSWKDYVRRMDLNFEAATNSSAAVLARGTL